jgi:Transglycosylase
MKINKRKIIITLSIFFTIIIGLVIAFYVYRDGLLKKGIAKATYKMERDYNSKLVIKSASFDGFTAIKLSEVSLVPNNLDTIFKAQKMKTSVSFWPLFLGDIQLGTLELNDGLIQLTKKGDVKNFEAFLKKDKKDSTANPKKRDYADFAYRVITKIFNLVPTDMRVENLFFKIDDNGKQTSIDFKKLNLNDEDLESEIDVKSNNFNQSWVLKGTADPRDNQFDIEFFNKDKTPIQIPYLEERYGLISSFNSFRLNVEDIDKSGDELRVDGYTSISDLKVNHHKIASKEVPIKYIKLDYRFLLGSNFVSIDSSSTLEFNKIKIHPYLSVNTEKDTVYKASINIPKMNAQDFITSLPDGLFTNFQGMQASGEFDYKLNFMINKNRPQTLVLNSKINKDNLKILRFGKANLSKINAPFEYRALIDSVFQRPIKLDSSNPNYTPLDQISPLLPKCVLTTEDPSFMKHKGFVTEAFRMALIKNLQTKKFTRGGSTISMQLIKNIFLTREKTLSRKLEEILLVYILENNHITTKQRMLEVYFNIIEWGPNVYGIGEASQFYFQKKPLDLSLNECLFLANIIPSPKKFMRTFDDYGSLSYKTTRKNDYITNIMIKRNLLTPEDIASRYETVNVSGRARSFLTIHVRVPDTTAIKTDSIKAVYEEFGL